MKSTKFPFLQQQADAGNASARINVLLLCDSFPAGEKAMRIYEQLAQQFDGQLFFHKRLIEFRELSDDLVACHNFRGSNVANVVIVAACKSILPSAVKNWIAQWSVQRKLRKVALIGLPISTEKEDESLFHDYLNGITVGTDISYFGEHFHFQN